MALFIPAVHSCHLNAQNDGIEDGQLNYCGAFYDAATATELLNQLRAQLPWQQLPIVLFGKSHLQPRLIYWCGDRDYRYSRQTLAARPWPPLLATLRDQVNAATQRAFNHVLVNYYRQGGDSMGWHSDDEPELGDQPAIASLSLGDERRFLLRHRAKPLKAALVLGHGSLLLMHGPLQRHWQHALPKTRRPMTGRINLTFRRIGPPFECPRAAN